MRNRKPTQAVAGTPPKRKLAKARSSAKAASNIAAHPDPSTPGQPLNNGSNPVLHLRTGEILQLPSRKPGTENKGLSFSRLFSNDEVHPYHDGSWEIKTYKKHGFEREVEAPSFWAYTDVLITAEKYLFGARDAEPEFENSLKHAFDRISNTYTVWGWQEGYFKTLRDAEIFNEELKALQVNQIWAPNSPVWFNIGHYEQWRWGRPDLRHRLTGGNKSFGTTATTEDGAETNIAAFEAPQGQCPQASACFLIEVQDSMESILENYLVEGRIFSSGSGVGINLSTLRSSFEPIQGKGKSSGPISFDRGFDRSAGGIKSAGRTRRAARMAILDSDHPDIFEFIRTKNRQEEIGKIILKEHNTLVQLRGIAVKMAENGTIAEKLAANTILSFPEINNTQYSPLMDGLLYGETLGHQNANHSVSLKGDFWKAYNADGTYSTRWVTNPQTVQETFPASKLMEEMCTSAWENAEPGSHNSDWINLWNPVKSQGPITTSNPCSEYLHRNGTACNLSSFNAYRFLKKDRTFDAPALQQATRLAMTCADLNISRGGFPLPEIAEQTRRYRTTGIGFTNLGGTIMALGLAYDSDDARFIAAQLVTALTATCWQASAELAEQLGAYEAYQETKNDLRQVLNLHEAAFNQLQHLDHQPAYLCQGKDLPQAQGLAGIDALRALKQSFLNHKTDLKLQAITESLSELTQNAFQAIKQATAFRNSFVSLIAPTGTISFPLAAYTEGTSSIEPDYSLVKTKNLAGGGFITMFNGMSLVALQNLQYPDNLVKEAALEAAGISGLLSACNNNERTATDHLLSQIDKSGPVRETVTNFLNNNITPTELFESAAKQNFPNEEYKLVAKGKNHLEQVPWLKPEHLSVFDCSATHGDGQRSIDILGHIRMLGAIQPFISGASSKTCNLPYTATPEDFKRAFVTSHALGVKCIALYRADSKGISVYSTDTPEARKFDPNLIWKKLVTEQQHILSSFTPPLAPTPKHPKRRKLPGLRLAQTVKFQIQDLKGYLTVGTYPDGSCGEIFCRVGQSGTFASGILETWCKSISVTLQYGIPLDEIMQDFRAIAFEPSGLGIMGLSHENEGGSKTIMVSSIVDMIVKILDHLFPLTKNGRILRPIPLPDPTFEFVDELPTSEPLAIPSSSNILFTDTHADRGGALCPKCYQMSYIQDGRCKRCNNPSCGYKDGGCGD